MKNLIASLGLALIILTSSVAFADDAGRIPSVTLVLGDFPSTVKECSAVERDIHMNGHVIMTEDQTSSVENWITDCKASAVHMK